MKKLLYLLTMIFVLNITGCDFKNNKPLEVEVDTKSMQELPKVVFVQLKNYVESIGIDTIAKNTGEFDITKVDIGNNLYLNKESYYYVSNGDIYMYLEYIYNGEYLVKMLMSNDEDNISGFSYELIDKDNK